MYNKGVWFWLRSSKGETHKNGRSERGSIESDLNQSDDSRDNLIRNVGERVEKCNKINWRLWATISRG